ncbi:NUDIX hydrolase [Shinella sumterensis]|uniref:NUDIX domain-containing protein n=1 Tax=Shinella sumterensis TaxID=1967501 RepID=A0AA50H5G1_9HYPH|nr:NUDIX domain-containing protein [Shinella sumterensis]WLR98969.1 NUDIX domain-containing protein [Shinella sumterensis]
MTAIRPVDAASILLLDRTGTNVRVLVGRRSSRHVFMPDVYVFPGGRRDANDRLLPIASPLHALACERLAIRAGARCSDSRLRALAVAAIRELYEETGISVGTPLADPAGNALPFLPDLSRLRFLARAITPAGMVRRYDTRFFTLFTDEAGVDPAAATASHELEDLRWVNISDHTCVEMPDITVLILEELQKSLQEDKSLPFGRAVPLYHTRHGRFLRDLL